MRRDALIGMAAAGLTLAGSGRADATAPDPDAVPQPLLGEIERRVAGSSQPMRLPYRRYRRGDRPRPTFFFLGGGPGVGNLGFVPPASWLHEIDVVVLEYRGVGRSSFQLKTPHFARALSEPLARLSVQGAQAMQPALAEGFADLAAQGIDFGEFSLAAMAGDVEALRQHLGLERIGLVAHSFGTRVALEMQTRHRDRVAASLLLSLNTPGGMFWYPEQTQSVWRRYAAWLAAERHPLHERLAPMLEEPLTRAQGWSPDDTRALVVAFFMSFNNGTRDRALQTLVDARHGRSVAWWLMGASYPMVVRFAFNWADFFVKGYVADGSRERLALVDAQGERALFQSPSAVLFAGQQGFESAGGRPGPQTVPDYARTLAVIGEFDPSTPIERWPDALAPAQRVVLPRAGHADVLHAPQALSLAWLRSLLPHFENRDRS